MMESMLSEVFRLFDAICMMMLYNPQRMSYMYIYRGDFSGDGKRCQRQAMRRPCTTSEINSEGDGIKQIDQMDIPDVW